MIRAVVAGVVVMLVLVGCAVVLIAVGMRQSLLEADRDLE